MICMFVAQSQVALQYSLQARGDYLPFRNRIQEFLYSLLKK